MLLAMFRVLLRLCPKHLRRDYGREMEALFVECVERERRRRGPWHRRWSYARGLVDVVVFAAGARWEQFRSRPLRLGQSLTRTTRRTPVIAHDLRGALRAMRAQPVMSSAIVVMLALGVGATTAIFSVVHGVLLKPLPFPEPDRIVQVFGSNVSRGWARITLTEANFWDLHDQNTTLEAFGALSFDSFTMTGAGANAAPERVSGGKVTTGVFRSLGVRPVAGRLFETGEDLPGRGESLALLSHRLWTRGFAADPAVVGRSITLDGRPYTVIGVLPPGTPWLDVAEVFVPFLRRANPNRGSFEYTGIARLKPGVTIDAALADLTAIARRLEASYPGTNTGVERRARSIAFVGRERPVAADALDPARRRRAPAPHRRLERHQSPARPRLDAGAGERRPHGARREPRRSDPRASDRIAALQRARAPPRDGSWPRGC